MGSDESRESPRRSRTDVAPCVFGRIKFVEEASADASHKKSGKVVPRRRMAELEEFILCFERHEDCGHSAQFERGGLPNGRQLRAGWQHRKLQ